MMRLYLLGHGETLASALRPEVERGAADDEVVSVVRPHPEDDYLELNVPDAAALRAALLALSHHIRDTRSRLPPHAH